VSEAAITFSCNSDILVGILHRPDSDERELGILIVVGGPQYRVGSHRQFTLMARILAAAGFPVFRFDYRGMGDSTGDPRTFESVDEDIRAAVDAFVAAAPGVHRVVLFGLCDAAAAVWMYCLQDARLAGLILANPWVRTLSGEGKAFVRHYYLRRLLQRSFWTKAFSGGLRPKDSARGVLTYLRQAVTATTRDAKADAEHFLDRMRRGAATFAQPTLILLSDRDLTAREFEGLVQDSREWGNLTARPNVEVSTVCDSDHTFSGRDSLERATRITQAWLTKMVRQ
jgi:exosortase A-associated hydrolase 1